MGQRWILWSSDSGEVMVWDNGGCCGVAIAVRLWGGTMVDAHFMGVDVLRQNMQSEM